MDESHMHNIGQKKSHQKVLGGLLHKIQNQVKIIHSVEVKIVVTLEEKGWVTDRVGHEVSFWNVDNGLFLDKVVFKQIFTL